MEYDLRKHKKSCFRKYLFFQSMDVISRWRQD